jgi:hypothetical protein
MKNLGFHDNGAESSKDATVEGQKNGWRIFESKEIISTEQAGPARYHHATSNQFASNPLDSQIVSFLRNSLQCHSRLHTGHDSGSASFNLLSDGTRSSGYDFDHKN